jgi:hypothetical protein
VPIFAPKTAMLNRKLTMGILAAINAVLFTLIAFNYGLASMNNWLLIVSIAFMSMAIYRVLGMVEGYRN